MSLRPYDNIRTTAEVRETANRLGSHLFDPKTMRFFQSRLSERIRPISPSSGYYIMSDVYGDEPRHWSVRRYDVVRDYRTLSDGSHYDYDTFNDELIESFPSAKAAHAYMKSI